MNTVPTNRPRALRITPLGLLFALAVGCGGETDSEGASGTDTDSNDSMSSGAGSGDSESGASGTAPDAGGSGSDPANCEYGEGGTSPADAPCTENDECSSLVCVKYGTSNQADGACAPAPDGCRTRLMGRVSDAADLAPLEGVELKLMGIFEAAMDPEGTAALATGFSDAEGLFDFESERVLSPRFGAFLYLRAEGYVPSLHASLAPTTEEGQIYPPASKQRDLYMVSESTVAGWDARLAEDPDVAESVPLSGNGGNVFVLRWHDTGERISGARLVAAEGSSVVVRYLSEDGQSFGTESTSSQGIAIVVNAGAGETLDLQVEGGTYASNFLQPRAGTTAGPLLVLMTYADRT